MRQPLQPSQNVNVMLSPVKAAVKLANIITAASSAETIQLDATTHLALFDDTLGRGGFGSVRSGELVDAKANKSSRVAVKVISHSSEEDGEEGSDRDDIEREIRAHRQLFDAASPPRHLLVELLSYIHQPSRSLLVLELVDGAKELQCLVDESADGRLAEADARSIGLKLAQALAFCHSQGVAHLDIKPGNVLVSRSSADCSDHGADEDALHRSWSVRLIDLGCADLFDPSDVSDAWVEEAGGTDNYMAPERHFDDDERGFLAPHADVYGLGCVYFFMLHGFAPYDWAAAHTDAASAEVIRAVRDGALPFGALDEDGRPRPMPSDDARDLVSAMTRADPLERPSAAVVAEHRWLQQQQQLAPSADHAEAALAEQLGRLAM